MSLQPTPKRPGLVKRVSTAIFSRKKKAITPAVSTPNAPSELASGKKLQERMWVPNTKMETLDVKSDELDAVRLKAASSFGGECSLHAAKIHATTGEAMVAGLAKDGKLLGIYELNDEMGGVLFRRVCDRPARDLVKAGVLPSDWPSKYEPPNPFGGNRKLPSSTSVKDILSAS